MDKQQARIELKTLLGKLDQLNNDVLVLAEDIPEAKLELEKATNHLCDAHVHMYNACFR